jgi:hypothetical protein
MSVARFLPTQAITVSKTDASAAHRSYVYDISLRIYERQDQDDEPGCTGLDTRPDWAG